MSNSVRARINYALQKYCDLAQESMIVCMNELDYAGKLNLEEVKKVVVTITGKLYHKMVLE